MRILTIAASLAALAAMPVLAMQPAQNKQAQRAGPHTMPGELTLYEMTNWNGEDRTIDTAAATVRTNWPIRSISVHPGEIWQVCARPRFRDCIILDRSVNDASLLGITGQIGSARPAPAAAPPAPAR
jgi:hypothetical protein